MFELHSIQLDNLLVLVSKSGIDVKTEEEDSEDFYTITVKIPKKK